MFELLKPLKTKSRAPATGGIGMRVVVSRTRRWRKRREEEASFGDGFFMVEKQLG